MSRKRIILTAGLAAVGLGLTLYLWALGRPRRLTGSGAVEARNIRVGSKVGGRIVDVRVREGDRVKAGDVLVVFDDQELLAALEKARANLQKMERGYRPEEIQEARAAAAQARAEDEEARPGARPARARPKPNGVNRGTTGRGPNSSAGGGVSPRQQRDDAEAAWK